LCHEGSAGCLLPEIDTGFTPRRNLDEAMRLKELEDARQAESNALLSAQAQAFGHP
jgi:hypothetical protein